MGTRAHEIYDVVGIGFGPSNLSLAISLEEHQENVPAHPTRAAFFERQSAFGWHRNMLLPSATMQISFLKDLATFRNPVSRFGYVSFLHESGRLARFVNNMDFFPTRLEFHQYLEWAASRFTDRVSYGSDVTAIRLPQGAGAGSSEYLQVEARDNATGSTRVVNARNVAISTGLVPRMPDGMERDERVWHSSEFLEKYRRMNPGDLKSVAVVGAGQSAAEITRFLYDSLPHAEVSAIFPSYGYSVADDTPFANQIFDPDAVDDYYYGTDKARESFWRYHKNTNYSVVDSDVIKDLYRRSYDEDVQGTERLHFLNMTRVREVKRAGDETRVLLDTLLDGHTQELDVDAIVFATGYDSMEPSRLLGDLDRYCLRDAAGRHRVQRDNRLVTTPELSCGIYIQGGTEHTHGLSSALLSNIAVRSGEIADSIVGSRPARDRGQPLHAAAV
ncbi:L-lysine 6-monooxygenase (plasmid) [Streptomyces lunaelactis]|uniref:L-lysine N6-monooxygenase MbtG n=1 Tax=Streptomyces lunaelactis TaxID=1535768 RepID=A0A2R4TFN0_9ACTN|nr:SidA/IucD/PvdA family monooxygenase [Streptomyces lunaelactis]AVZ77913.1 L-lysine 6-monooxygenase [Streptomyces lunaelactis]NUK83426.1 lysine N(6)-hydroxylase/L-ornithine N(5)-oxygenase family protein [Streptomyces lunaelactis]NUL01711.1 lysine N(6)-hydroxylase/L-ornithine N(5)-oxygenase family protein [Streptomyces lunaelactis]